MVDFRVSPVRGDRVRVRAAAVVAACGWMASAGLQVALRLEPSGRRAWLAVPLLIGMLIVWFPAVIHTGRIGFRFSDRKGWWALTAMSAVFAFINFWLLPQGTVEWRTSLALSGHLMAFYAFAVVLLRPAQGVKR